MIIKRTFWIFYIWIAKSKSSFFKAKAVSCTIALIFGFGAMLFV